MTQLSPRPRVAIAGASGFVGSHLIPALRERFDVVALARQPRESANGVEWRVCDLFTPSSTRAALEGVDVAIYLVHSMMPSSRLFQGNFHDTDLLLADNFVRACIHHGVKQIIYLGGLVPEAGFVSQHLQSRHEVEEVLQLSGIPLTALRAGMVVGAGGSSFEILSSLVSRLRWMVLPKWTQSLGQAVYIDDVVAVLQGCILDPSRMCKTFNLTNGESLSYERMLRLTAAAMGKTRRMIQVPISSTGFSKRWVQLFSGSSYELVSPLIDSLQCDLPQPQPEPEIAELIRYRSFKDMLRQTFSGPPAIVAQPPRARASGRRQSTVRSIQRLPPMPNHDTRFISNEYMTWLPKFFRFLIRVHRVEGTTRLTFSSAFWPSPLLVLELIEDASGDGRDKFHIVGGVLSKTTTTGWFEFKQVADRRHTLAAIHGFVPALPWLIYRMTQAPVHAWVMHRFGMHLARVKARSSESARAIFPLPPV
jgi:uncharacterized protein YbjT (DUF2867 family)